MSVGEFIVVCWACGFANTGLLRYNLGALGELKVYPGGCFLYFVLKCWIIHTYYLFRQILDKEASTLNVKYSLV